MSTRDLNTQEMASVTLGWVEADKDLFLSIPLIAPLFPQVEAAHTLVVKINTTQEVALHGAQLTAELGALDGRHDQCIRAVSSIIHAAIQAQESADAPELSRAEALKALATRILPDGLSWVTASYNVEIGHALRVMNRLSASDKALLETLTVEGETALDLVARWEALGRRMAEGQRKRSTLQQAGAVDLRDARQTWQRVVGMVVHLLTDGDVPASDADPLLQPLNAAMELAARQGAAAEAEAPAEGEGAEGAAAEEGAAEVASEEGIAQEAQGHGALPRPAQDPGSAAMGAA